MCESGLAEQGIRDATRRRWGCLTAVQTHWHVQSPRAARDSTHRAYATFECFEVACYDLCVSEHANHPFVISSTASVLVPARCWSAIASSPI